ncbi:uncharacterized protein BDW43DRAFT_282997, partial [Aspergillus alliaceus]|uniref:uncharacterized protein n=1 Tax=Petromyces alliaceus TaxID=209559 RepID=UPI0012A53073
MPEASTITDRAYFTLSYPYLLLSPIYIFFPKLIGGFTRHNIYIYIWNAITPFITAEQLEENLAGQCLFNEHRNNSGRRISYMRRPYM